MILTIQIDLCDRAEVEQLRALLDRALELTAPPPPAPALPDEQKPAEDEQNPAADEQKPAADEQNPASAEGLSGFKPVEVADLAGMPGFKGRACAEKGALWGKMQRYRQARGLGCWLPLAAKLHKSDDWVRSVYAAEIAVPLDVWRKIGAAIDQIEKEESQ